MNPNLFLKVKIKTIHKNKSSYDMANTFGNDFNSYIERYNAGYKGYVKDETVDKNGLKQYANHHQLATFITGQVMLKSYIKALSNATADYQRIGYEGRRYHKAFNITYGSEKVVEYLSTLIDQVNRDQPITDANVEHLVEILTTTQWINHNHYFM